VLCVSRCVFGDVEGTFVVKVYIPSKRARFGIKSFELCEAKSVYVRNYIIYTGHSICHLSCCNVSGGIIVLVKIS
jgi:hypothetical protein